MQVGRGMRQLLTVRQGPTMIMEGSQSAFVLLLPCSSGLAKGYSGLQRP
jgi:hypothetical protein